MRKRDMFIRKCVAGLAAASMLMASFSGAAMAEAATEGANAADELGVVSTNFGDAQGVPGDDYNVTVFKGVPYAAPPVGDLRWAAPVDPDSWDGVRVFDTYADAPEQWPNDMAADPWKTDFYYDELPNFSEDCLYLNITTPSTTGDENYPVYIWFHGGGLNHGYSYEVECNPEALAAKGVVVVEVGTRLGVFGYLSLPQLDEESDYGASGNYGLMDSIKAVQWVKDNITGFGGNPDNITVGGQSGGTSKSGAILASKEGAALVNNVIWQTGLQYSRDYSTVEDNEERSIAWLQSCGLTGDESLEELRAMDASVFMGKEEEYGNAPQSMVQDGKYITVQNMAQAYADGYYKDVNILVGTNLGEFSQDGVGGNAMETASDFYDYYKEALGDLYDEYNFEDIVQVDDDNALDTARVLNSLGVGSSSGAYTSEVFGQYYATLEGDGNVYVYLFSHRTPGRNEDYYWAWHSSELWYVFGSLRDIPEQRDWEDWDYQLADICTSYWANFMTNGDPNGEGLAQWAAATDENAFMDLGDEDTLTCVESLDQFGELPDTVKDPAALQELALACGHNALGV